MERHQLSRRLSRMSFEDAKAESVLLEEEVSITGAVMRTFQRNAIGLVSDAVRTTPNYQAARARYQRAFAALRDFNAVYTKVFAKELRIERTERRKK